MVQQRKRFPASVVVWSLSATAALACCTALLSKPLGEYDDSLILLGARLVGVGRLPYIDFYSHYGPLGYSLLAAILKVCPDPALALRGCQASLLIVVAMVGGLSLSWKVPESKAAYGSAVALLAFCMASTDPAFVGVAFTFAGIALFLAAQRQSVVARSVSLNIAAGAVFGAALLVRPAFAIYALAAVVCVGVCAESSLRDALRRPLIAARIFVGATAAVAGGVWVLLYWRISPLLAFREMVIMPASLTGSGGARFLHPSFMPRTGNVTQPLLTAAGLFVMTNVWSFWRARSGVRWILATCAAVAGFLPITLRAARNPGRAATVVSVLLFTLAALVCWFRRSVLRESNVAREAATFGLTASAFGHYFWVRADDHHLFPLLGFALVGVLLILPVMRAPTVIAVGALLLFVYASTLGMTAPRALTRVLSGDRGGLPKGTGASFANDAIAAVKYADRCADPGSRFVAVGTSQAWSSADPVDLFLMSHRLPYTRWFQYDPGLQDSPDIQTIMKRELEASGSDTAVIWRSDLYLADEARPPRDLRSPFDEFVDRLYPVTLQRFGPYVVRGRTGVMQRGDIE